MKYCLFLFILFTCISSPFAQIGMGEWKMYVSPFSAVDVVYGNQSIYSTLENGVLEYDTQSGEQTLWTAADYLSDASPTAIGYHEQTKSLLIGYNNGNIDLLKNNSVYNLPFLKQSLATGLKRINRVVMNENYAYLATGVGIIVLNLDRKEIKDTYHPSNENEEFLDIAFFQEDIYVLTKSAIYVGNNSNAFLANPAQWTKLSTIPDYLEEGSYTQLEVFQDDLFLKFNHLADANDTLFKVVNGNLEVFFTDKKIFGVNGENEKLLISTDGSLYIFDNELNQSDIIYQYGSGMYMNPNNACVHDNTYYIADRNNGLVKARDSYNFEILNFEGPRFNSFYRAKWLKGKLSVACGGFNATSPSFSQKGGATMQGNKWSATIIYDEPVLKNTATWDFISTAINPKNTDEVAYGTYSGMPLVITNNGSVTDTFQFTNSLIESVGAIGWGRITDLTYDTKGNLWIANALADKPLKVRTENGLWYEFDNAMKGELTKRLIIDQNGVKWMTTKGVGLVAYDDGNSIEDTSDDRFKVFNSGVNTGGLPSNDIEAIAVDFDNNIWIGTPEGIRVLYNTSQVFDAQPGEYNFQKLLIEYGEFIEIILGTTHITSIQIDGQNRKWIGTAGAGVFLLSPNGLEVVANFSAENSPLLSNSILDIAINHDTGEVYFITDNGMISYRSDASQGDSEYTNVKVFPNPVYPDFLGPITIQGIAYDSDVRITDVSGKLIYKTHSNGGTATWSGKTLDGERAATGVYLIWTSIDSETFKGRKVGKVLLIN